jgi:hypothetical protein
VSALVVAVFSLGLLAVVIELARRRQLVEEYALIWIGAAVALTALSLRRGVVARAAEWAGMGGWPPAAAVAAAATACVAALWVSVLVSRQRRQIERLTEETAILAAELRELRSRRT